MYYAIIHSRLTHPARRAHRGHSHGEAARKIPDAAYQLTLSRLAGNPRRDWERIGS